MEDEGEKGRRKEVGSPLEKLDGFKMTGQLGPPPSPAPGGEKCYTKPPGSSPETPMSESTAFLRSLTLLICGKYTSRAK